MENSYFQYGHLVPTPAMVDQLQSLGISAYHHYPWMPNSFFPQGQAFPPHSFHFQVKQVYPPATSTNHPDMNTGKKIDSCFSILSYSVLWLLCLYIEKMEKHRERNREHAKRTRLRKKVFLDGMKTKLLELQQEFIHLQKMMDERNTANILLAFSSTDSSRRGSVDDDLHTLLPENDDTSSIVSGGDLIEQLRTSVRQDIHDLHPDDNHVPKRIRRDSTFSSEENSVNLADMQEEIDGLDSDNEDVDHFDEHTSTYQPIPESMVDWKTGTVVNAQGNERHLTDAEMYQFCKERNRMHAKMTRDRKKLFTLRMQKLITTLEQQNAKIKNRLSDCCLSLIR